MAITYKKNAQNVYKVPFYVQFLDVVGFGFSFSRSVFGAGAGCID